ncbi:MAG: ABC transporter substrate-binding protein [Burkholderiales bacterium RIFCSPLOWO2_02_FULL_57_36]|nr:MAG: ABC transporter substrate-binding protein [Burkholderiales bacterium RIFCSPLOWO2_02_FULL_57_36]
MIVHADNTAERAGRNGVLTVGMHHVVPPYVAGAKFRTPENIDSALAEAVSGSMKLKLNTVPVPAKEAAKALASRKADIALAAIPDADPLRKSVVIVPTGYSSGPMAIMRSDTDIKTWEQLKGRKVCVSGDGRYAGTIAEKYGATEVIFRAPADALLALRIGGCDAAVHDSAVLAQLIKLPEWKKFSARLPIGPVSPLVFTVPAKDTQTARLLNRVADEWFATGYLTQLTEKMARNIAFEVYLDQNVPDCH